MGRDRQRNSAKPPKHMGFGPIVVDWACSLQKNKKRFRRHILMPCMELLALLKYPFCYTIWRGFGKFFGMIHVLTRHLAPELDRFQFCPGFWSMLYFGRKLDIFGDVSTRPMIMQ